MHLSNDSRPTTMPVAKKVTHVHATAQQPHAWHFTAKDIGYFCFLIPLAVVWAAVVLGNATGWVNLFAYFPLAVAYIAIPIADYLIGTDITNPDSDIDASQMGHPLYYRLLTLACVPIHIAILITGIVMIANTPALTLVGQIGWMISIGVMSGTLAINVGHELIHKKTRLEQWAGGLLLSTVCYSGFKVEHLRGHHVNVSTPADASSARYNQSVYAFLPQAYWHNVLNAWKLEAKRLRGKGLPALHFRNELLWWHAITLAIGVAFWVYFGAIGLIYFLVQSFVAITQLEIVNYVEHYGLHRRKLSNGRYERPTVQHSWNSSYLLTNLIFFQLQRHSDHHANPGRRYQLLRHFDESPQLPGGYPSMVLLALVPPLWRRIINPRVQAYYAGEEHQLTSS